MKDALVGLGILLLAGCAAGGPPPQRRAPTQANFQLKAEVSSSSGESSTLYLDTSSGQVRSEGAGRVILATIGQASPYTVLFPAEKRFFVYDGKREAKLAEQHRVGERELYAKVGRESRGAELGPSISSGWLVHPCERARVQFGGHYGCQHTTSPDGIEHWSHSVTRRASMQEGFKEYSESMGSDYDPRRGLVLSEQSQNRYGSFGRSLVPQADKVDPQVFRVPVAYHEMLDEAGLQARVLPAVGRKDMTSGAPWKMIEDYQDEFPEGPTPRAQCSRERWIRGGFGRPDHQEILIWHLIIRDKTDLLAKGTARDLNKEFRLSSHFIDPQADPPPKQPFSTEPKSCTLVRKREAFWVSTYSDKRQPGLDARELLDRIS